MGTSNKGIRTKRGYHTQEPKLPEHRGPGRPKGVKNNKTVMLEQAFEAHDFDLVKELIDSLRALPKDERPDYLIRLMEFVFPRRRAVDMKIEGQMTSFAEFATNVAAEVDAVTQDIEDADVKESK